MKTTTYVPREMFEAIMTKLGIAWTTQSGFLKAEPVKGRRLYVAATKKVGRVDLSGFEVSPSLGLTKRPDQGEFGQVKQQLEVSGTQEEVLARFEAVATHLLTLAPAEKPAKVKAPKAPRAAKPTEGEVPMPPKENTPEAIKARIELIKRVAEEKGVPVSASTLAIASS